MNFQNRFTNWLTHQATEAAERDRVAFLNTAQPRNDARLLAPTRVRVLRPFMVNGAPVKVNEIVTLERHEALSLRALGRCELTE
ncbi:MAG TPA: hypothetical protein VF203_07740 [Burkholderiales bacterium]